MLGGILIESNDVDLPDGEYQKTQSVLKYSIFKDDYPFLLPTAICGGFISINALLWTYLFVIDVNINRDRNNKNGITAIVDENKSTLSIDTIEMASNLTANTLKPDNTNDENFGNNEEGMTKADINKNEYLAMHQSLPTYTEFKSMITRLEPDRMKLLSNLRESRDNFDDEMDVVQLSTVSDMLKHTFLGHSLLQYGIAAISHMMFKEMGPVFMAQALLFDSMYIGYSQAFAGVVLFIFTLIVQPWCLKKFNHKLITSLCAIGCFFTMMAMPSVYWFTLTDNQIMQSGEFLLMMVFVVEFIITQTVSIVFVVATCWVNNSVPQHCLGKANGIGQTMAAFVRGFGPLLTGFIWSESFQQIENDGTSYAVYYAYLPGALFYLIGVIDIIMYIPSNLQYTWEQRKKDEMIKF